MAKKSKVTRLPASAGPEAPKPRVPIDPEGALWWARRDLEPAELAPTLARTAETLRAAQSLLHRFGQHLSDEGDSAKANPALGVSEMLGIEAAVIEGLRHSAEMLEAHGKVAAAASQRPAL